MRLVPINEGAINTDHFMHLVSAYVNNRKQCDELKQQLLDAVKIAAEDRREVFVSQDTLDFMFVVFPTGVVGLYAKLSMFHIEESK